MNTFSYKFGFIIAAVLLTGCATQVPAPISTIPAGNLSVAEAQSDPARFKGTAVRWGGMITRVENRPSQTWVEVVSHELQKNGEPLPESGSSGRFIASFAGFIDPMVYGTGRLLTIVGTVDDLTTRPIGEYNYTFPVVTVTTSHLWPVEVEEPPRLDYPPPWWYYDPWPFYPRPYPPLHPHYR